MSEKCVAQKYISKKLLAFLKEEEANDLMTRISRELSNNIVDKLMTELGKGERIVKLSSIHTEDDPTENTVMYTQQVKMDELVRCKDCIYKDGSVCNYSAVWVHPNGYCNWGKKGDADDV